VAARAHIGVNRRFRCAPALPEGNPLRPERMLSLERLVRDELVLQRRLAAGRRAASASARMAALRQVAAAAPAPLPDREAA